MHYYLFYIQYLGFRYHGWQKQPGVKTVELMLEKTARFVLGHDDFRILGASRTDSKVSARQSAFELFVNVKLDSDFLLQAFNENLPNDIRVTKVMPVGPDFNIIQAPRFKEYLYLFDFGKKNHPFCAPLVYTFSEELDIEIMKQGALLFKGTHNFVRYCTKPGAGKTTSRTIEESCIEANTEVSGGFFPEHTWCYRVRGKGFMRNQVRLMMGQLLRLGRGEIGLDDIRQSLTAKDPIPLKTIAPASGLTLNRVKFDERLGSGEV